MGAMLELRMVALSDIELYEGNLKINDVDLIMASIDRHGFNDPPHFDKTLGAISDGNGRVKALKRMHKLGWPPPRGIEDTGYGWMVPVLFGEDAADFQAATEWVYEANATTVSGTGIDESLLFVTDIPEPTDAGSEESLPELGAAERPQSFTRTLLLRFGSEREAEDAIALLEEKGFEASIKRKRKR